MEEGVLQVLEKWMQGEINNCIKVWISVYISLSYCYFASKIIPIGFPRLLAFLPVILLFLALPLYLHTIHLGGGLSVFFIAWMSNFKLLMFCFGIGPLSYPSCISLLHFLAIGSLSIKIQHQTPSSKRVPKSPMNYAVKTLLVALFVRAYDYIDYIHPKVVCFIRLASLPAVLATFVMSAIMHELMFYYLGRVRPRWVVTLFFLLHGFCLVVEIAVKRALGDRLRLPKFVSRTLAVVLFVLATGLSMFLPELLKCNADTRAFEEYAAVGKFVKDLGHALMAKQIRETKP